MIRVRRFSNAMAAERAASFLRDNGVPATVVGDHIHQAAGMLGMRFSQPEVVVPTEAHRERAEILLAELDKNPMVLSERLDDASKPDLSCLDAETHSVDCPTCGAGLPLDSAVEACPECSAEVDIPNLIVDKYGPETLIDCYAADPDADNAAADPSDRRPMHCPACGYNLGGLPTNGRCPECGRLYDKHRMEKLW